jgi:hypothetical protein
VPSRGSLIIRTAERPGNPTKPSEDRIFTTDNAVILLDGATQYEQRTYDGGWIAENAGKRIQAGLIDDPGVNLVDLVEQVIVDLVGDYGLVPGDAPSTTLALLRLGEGVVDALVIADSPVLIKRNDGELIEVRDSRLDRIVAQNPRPPGLADRSDPDWERRYRAIESQRNQPGGFWTIAASPQAAREAVTYSMGLGEFEAALLMSDGVSILHDVYEPGGWASGFDRFVDDPSAAIEQTVALEAADPHATRWPRSKQHDDKAIASVGVT